MVGVGSEADEGMVREWLERWLGYAQPQLATELVALLATVRAQAQAEMAEENARLRAALEGARRVHVTNDEDGWYACPKSADGCLNEKATGCTCGADAHNARIDAALSTPPTTRDAGPTPPRGE